MLWRLALSAFSAFLSSDILAPADLAKEVDELGQESVPSSRPKLVVQDSIKSQTLELEAESLESKP